MFSWLSAYLGHGPGCGHIHISSRFILCNDKWPTATSCSCVSYHATSGSSPQGTVTYSRLPCLLTSTAQVIPPAVSSCPTGLHRPEQPQLWTSSPLQLATCLLQSSLPFTKGAEFSVSINHTEPVGPAVGLVHGRSIR